MENPTLYAILGIMFWFASGYFLAYIRVKIWEDILIKKRMGDQIEFKNWDQKDLRLIALMFPWQTFRWRVSKFNKYGWEEFVPIIPVSLFISIINRSNIMGALLKGEGYYRQYVIFHHHHQYFNAHEFKKQQTWLIVPMGPLGFVVWFSSLVWTVFILSLTFLFKKSTFVAHADEIDFPNHHKTPSY